MRFDRTIAAFAAALAFNTGAFAADQLKLAIGQRGNWENAAPHLGQQAGIFGRHGLELDLLYTQGAGETLQAVVSGSVDVGIGVGTPGVMSAFAKGAPVRAIANSTTGAGDLFWYVPATSPVQTMKDTGGRSIAFSTNGSSTHVTVLALMKQSGVDAKPVATGNPASTFTQTMSGQVDVGWSSPPFGIEAVDAGRIRIVARGSDVPSFRTQTVRFMITGAPTLAAKADAIARFVQAYQETLDWMYSDDAALKAYAEWVGIGPDLARKVRDGFYPKDSLRTNRLSGLDAAMKDAVDLKFLARPLTDDQLAQLIRYPTAPSP